MKRIKRTLPLSYDPICWSRRDLNPDLVLFKDVVPPAFVTKSDCKMATRFDENSRPASRPAGRNLNPLVANVFPPAFAIKILKDQNPTLTVQRRPTSFFAETLQLRCSPRRHSARKIISIPAQPRPMDAAGHTPLASAHKVSESISPTQCSAPSRPSANAAMT